METGTVQAKVKPANSAVLTGADYRVAQAPEISHKAAGYGLPCSKCRVYYPADLDRCPVCKSTDRMSPAAVLPTPTLPPITAASNPGTTLEDERERFLKELKSQAFQAHTQINAAASFRCCLDQNHNGNSEPAAVCHSCYGEIRQQADRMEAALHIDLKEAAQIVYNAVWADTSDPSRSYQNAAAALLTELRKRAGIGLLLGSNQPLPH